jgi:pyruvate/2-oxoglutarate dehydrogenase complex dihydrolipoamide acyltransferase (E2) component
MNILLPELGEGIQKATVAVWHKRKGDTVKRDEDVVEVVTDKAIFNVSSECDGVIEDILINEGQEAKIGEILAKIGKK